MTDRFEPIENIDESFDIDKDDNNNKSAMQNIVPFFKALDVMKKEGIINDENADFKRDVEFEKLITDQNFDPENLTEKELLTLNSYMNYIQSVILDNDNDKLMKAVNNLSKNSKKKKKRWRDIKKK